MASLTPDEQEQHFKMLFAAEFAKSGCNVSQSLQILNHITSGLKPTIEWLQQTAKAWVTDPEVLKEIERIKAYIPSPDEVKAKVWFDYSIASEEGKAKMQRNVLEAFGVIKKANDDEGSKGVDKLKEMLDASAK